MSRATIALNDIGGGRDARLRFMEDIRRFLVLVADDGLDAVGQAENEGADAAADGDGGHEPFEAVLAIVQTLPREDADGDERHPKQESVETLDDGVLRADRMGQLGEHRQSDERCGGIDGYRANDAAIRRVDIGDFENRQQKNERRHGAHSSACCIIRHGDFPQNTGSPRLGTILIWGKFSVVKVYLIIFITCMSVFKARSNMSFVPFPPGKEMSASGLASSSIL